MDVRKFVDLHFHVGPEPIPRKFTLPKLVREEKGKIGGVALKNHFYPTMPFIRSLDNDNGLKLIGSVVLNNYVGGLNPDVIYGSAKISDLPIIVWFPTINADNFLRNSKYEVRPEWTGGKFKSRLSSQIKGIKVIDKSSRLTYNAKNVLMAIKDNNCILATGHLSWQETKVLVSEALGMGIRKVIITHPIYQLIDMPIEVQKELTMAKGVYVEQAYSMYLIDGIGIEKIADAIREVGSGKCILSSDVGQINRPSPSVALSAFADLLSSSGISKEELRQMGELNPGKLIR